LNLGFTSINLSFSQKNIKLRSRGYYTKRQSNLLTL